VLEKKMEKREYLEKHYAKRDEDNRFSTKYGQIEYITTMHYIEKYLCNDNKIIEIGAGTGKY
jgi:hypothetical protein